MKTTQPPRHSWLASLPASILTATLLLSSCSSSPIQGSTEEEFTTQDTHVAIYAGNRGNIDALSSKGYLFTVGDNGKGKVVPVDPVSGARIHWMPQGLYVPTYTHEIFINDHLLHKSDRGFESNFQVNRSASPTGSSAFYSALGTEAVTVIDSQGQIVAQSENEGLFQQGVQCGEEFLGIANTEYNSHLLAQAAELSNVSSATGYDFLARLHPHTGTTPDLLAATPEDRSVRIGHWEPECSGRTVIAPVIKRTYPEASRDNGLDPHAGTFALQTWNADTSERAILPLTNDDGSVIEVSKDEEYSTASFLDGSTYTFALNTGRVLSVDIHTGLILRDFTIHLSNPHDLNSAFHITKNHAYALVVPENRAQTPTLTRYDLATGLKEETIELPGLRAYLTGNWLTGPLSVESIAIRPSYDEQLVSEAATNK